MVRRVEVLGKLVLVLPTQLAPERTGILKNQVRDIR